MVESLETLEKLRRKITVRRWVGEPYVGKRMKMHYFKRLFPRLLPGFFHEGPAVLEVGSEDACFTEWFSRLWPNGTVEGLELNESYARVCGQWAAEEGRFPQLAFRNGSVLDLDVREKYDLIFCLDVLGYIGPDQVAVKNMARALKKGGLLVIHQPNPTYRRFDGELRHVSPGEAHLITEGHVRHGYSIDELDQLLAGAGLRVNEIRPLHGRFSDLAHRIYNRLEHPSFLRLLSLPFTDVLWYLDVKFPTRHGNTLLAVATNP